MHARSKPAGRSARTAAFLLVALAACGGGASTPTAIDTTILSGPRDPFYADEDAVFTFESNIAGAEFEARIDAAGPWFFVQSPYVLGHWTDGNHRFEVRSVAPGGERDATPAVHLWLVRPVPDRLFPDLRVVFPPPACATDADTIAVRGTAGDDSGVVGVRVNGVEAVSTDGFATWTAEVPVPIGETHLTIEARDGAGNISVDRMFPLVRRLGPWMVGPLGPVYDAGHDRLLVADEGRDAILAVDPDSRRRTLLTDLSGSTAAVTLFARQPLAIDAEAGRLLVLARAGTITAVDLDSGAAEVLFPGTTTRDWGFGIPYGITYDAHDDRIFVSDLRRNAVHEVRLSTGDYRLVSVDPDGSGDTTDLVWDAPRGRILLGDQTHSQVLAVDPVTGARAPLPDHAIYAASLERDAVHDRVLVTGTGTEIEIYDFSPPGWRSVRLRGALLTWNLYGGVAPDPDGKRAWYSDPVVNTVFPVDLETEGDNIVPATDDALGTGPLLGGYESTGASAMAWDPRRDRMVLAHFVAYGSVQFPLLQTVDRATGNRAILSSSHMHYLMDVTELPPRGAGPDFEYVTQLAVDPNRDRYLALDGWGAALFAVDPESGDRTVLAREPEGGAPRWGEMAVDAGHDRVLVEVDGTRFLWVDLKNGAQVDAAFVPPTIQGAQGLANIAFVPGTDRLYGRAGGSQPTAFEFDPATGTATPVGPVASQVRDLLVTPSGNRILTLEDSGVYALDVATGARSRLSDPDGRLGEFPALPQRFCRDDWRGVLHFVTAGGVESLRGVFTFDPETGACVLVSRE